MKIYKEDKNYIIDGEKDLVLCHSREAYITLSKDIKHFTICNHNMVMLGRTSKLKILWMTIKFIFTKNNGKYKHIYALYM